LRDYSDKEMLDMRLVSALYKSLKSLRRKEAVKIKESGVTFAQFEVLVTVYHFSPLTVGSIIDRTLSSVGNISLVVNNLIKEGYLTGSKDVKDKRTKYINLSFKGEEFMSGFFPTHLENLDQILSVYTEEEKEHLIELLKKLR